MFRKFIPLLLISQLFAPQGLALPSDRKQPIEIESDHALRDEKLGKTVYTGGVVITQGTIQIKADEVTVINEGRKVARIICKGTPAHYQQQPATDQGLIFARASTIEYSLDKDQIALIKNASLEQNDSTISGERIEYDLPNELVKAQGDLTGRQRIQMIIPPSAHQHVRLGEQPENEAGESDARDNPPADESSDRGGESTHKDPISDTEAESKRARNGKPSTGNPDIVDLGTAAPEPPAFTLDSAPANRSTGENRGGSKPANDPGADNPTKVPN